MRFSSLPHINLVSTELMWEDAVCLKSFLAPVVIYFEFHSNKNRFMDNTNCTAEVLSKEPVTTLSCRNVSFSSDLKAQPIMNSSEPVHFVMYSNRSNDQVSGAD